MEPGILLDGFRQRHTSLVAHVFGMKADANCVEPGCRLNAAAQPGMSAPQDSCIVLTDVSFVDFEPDWELL